MSTARVSPISPPGSLLKGVLPPKKGAREHKTKPVRNTDAGHLEAIRQCACVACLTDPCGEAAHVRMTAPGKPAPGMAMRPDDEYAVPLCHTCHMRQHELGELPYWRSLNLDPIKIAAALYRMSPNVEAMRAAVFAASAISKA